MTPDQARQLAEVHEMLTARFESPERPTGKAEGTGIGRIIAALRRLEGSQADAVGLDDIEEKGADAVTLARGAYVWAKASAMAGPDATIEQIHPIARDLDARLRAALGD